MTMAVAVPVAMPVTARAAGPRRHRRAHGPIQHEEADADDDEEARGAHPRHIGESEPEPAHEQDVGQPDDDDCGDDVDDGDLNGHRRAAHHPRLARQEIGDDDEFSVARPQRMDGAVGERDRKGQQEGDEIVAALDGVHVKGHFGIRTALEVHQERGRARERAALFRDVLDRGRRGRRRLRHRRRGCERARCKQDTRQDRQRERAALPAPAGQRHRPGSRRRRGRNAGRPGWSAHGRHGTRLLTCL